MLIPYAALQVIRPYGLRFKIEVAFKQAIHTIGAYGYHFWMKGMRRTRRGGGDQYPHRASPTYRRNVQRKLRANDLHAQLGCIAQGILQVLAVNHRKSVWSNFHSWMRTMRPDATPSEAVAAQSLRATFPGFLAANAGPDDFTKFLQERTDWSRVPGIAMTA